MTVENEIKKLYGVDDICVTGNEVSNEEQKIVSISPKLDLILSGGMPEGCWVTLTGKPKVGKAQPLDSIIITPDGIKTMRDIAVGDVVCTPDGDTATVIATHPQGVKPIYRIIFKDGDSVECCEDHLWNVKLGKRDRVFKTLSLRNILLKVNKDIRIQLPKPVYFRKQHVNIDPYLLGLLIGDGSFVHSNINFTNIDTELIDYVYNNVGTDAMVVPVDKYTYRIKRKQRNHSVTELCKHIKEYGLFGHKSHTKFIPHVYKFNDYATRLAVIQGLMDTDGSINTDGSCEFSTTSLQLAHDFKLLINSIGGICVINERYTNYNHKSFKSYRCYIRTNNNKEIFRLKRKIQNAKTRQRYELHRRVDKIEYIGNKEAKCISIDSNSGLYLTDNFITTHNSTLALHMAAKCQLPENGARDVYYLDIERRLKKMNLKGVRGLNLDKFFVIRSTEQKQLSAQEFLKVAEHILKTQANVVIIIDSYSMLTHEAELVADVGTPVLGMGAYTLLAQFCRQMAQVVPVMKSNIIGITQLMANIGRFGPGPTTTEKGGNSIIYQGDIKLKAKMSKAWMNGEKQIGQIVTWLCEFSALGSPGQEIESYIRYGVGIDEVFELIECCVDLGLITANKSWFTLEFLADKPKMQGKESIYKALTADPAKMAQLQQLVKQTMCNES